MPFETAAANLSLAPRNDILVTWNDSQTDAVGWVAIDRVVNGVAGGGIFMHPNATAEEAQDIAFNMSKKFTVTAPQIGGAKAGVRYDHRKPDAQDVLRRFIESNGVLLRNFWVTAGDLNTSDAFIESVIRGMGLATCQATLGRTIAQRTGIADQSTRLGHLIVQPACEFFPLIEGAVGYGVAMSIREALLLTGRPLGGVHRVAIQGFGAVGSSLAYYLERDNIAKVVAIADKDGYLFNAQGIPVREALAARKAKVAELVAAGADKNTVIEHAKNLLCNLTHEGGDGAYGVIVRRSQPFGIDGDAAFLTEFLQSIGTVEVFSPCAMRYQVTPAIMDVLVQSIWKDTKDRYFVSGANNIMGLVVQDGESSKKVIEDKTGLVPRLLRQADVCVVPDWIANSGTAQLFHRGLSIEFDPNDEQLAQKVLDACAAPIQKYLQEAYTKVDAESKFLSYGCMEICRERLENPVPMTKQ